MVTNGELTKHQVNVSVGLLCERVIVAHRGRSLILVSIRALLRKQFQAPKVSFRVALEEVIQKRYPSYVWMYFFGVKRAGATHRLVSSLN